MLLLTNQPDFIEENCNFAVVLPVLEKSIQNLYLSKSSNTEL